MQDITSMVSVDTADIPPQMSYSGGNVYARSRLQEATACRLLSKGNKNQTTRGSGPNSNCWTTWRVKIYLIWK